MELPREIRGLLETLMKFPGIGEKTAEEIVQTLLSHPELQEELRTRLNALQGMGVCRVCGAWSRDNPCAFCTDPAREERLLVVPFPRGVWLFERAGFRGRYHVLGGLLSPLEGISAKDLRVEALRDRLVNASWKEVILALGATFEAETTAAFLREYLQEHGVAVVVTRLGVGLPVGKTLDRLDLDTLREALANRKPLNPAGS